MWSSSCPSDVDQLFPRRPQRVCNTSESSSVRRSLTSGCFEQNQRDLAPPSVHTDSLWTFNGSSTASTAFHSPSATEMGFHESEKSLVVSNEVNEGFQKLESSVKATNHGVIGSYPNGKVTTRLLWNRPEREEEEREEEALPSYLTYLQAPSLTGDTTAAALPTTGSFTSATALGNTSNDQMDMWSKELVRAVQNMISVQIQGQGQVTVSSSTVKNAGGGCNCDKRVAELEKQVKILADAQKERMKCPAMEETGSGMGDRVSTLEGRQSAFQSQLAQISKVLGVSVGKHGKSSQLKTLMQTLHQEIDSKVQIAIDKIEATCVHSATLRAEELIAAAAATTPSSCPTGDSLTLTDSNEKKRQSPNGCESMPISALSFSTMLNALAEEHETSLTRLSTHFDERLRLEGSQRIALEGRVQARLGEIEEWLQQVEGELGGSHFEPIPSSLIAAVSDNMTRLEAHLARLEIAWKQQQHDVKEVFAKVEQLQPNHLDYLRTQLDQQSDDVKSLRDSLETFASSTREETHAVARTSQGLKSIVEKLVRTTGSIDELLQQYVSTITHKVANVTREYVSVRIRDNNRLLDATLRARVPEYVLNESESFLFVRPDRKKKDNDHVVETDVTQES